MTRDTLPGSPADVLQRLLRRLADQVIRVAAELFERRQRRACLRPDSTERQCRLPPHTPFGILERLDQRWRRLAGIRSNLRQRQRGVLADAWLRALERLDQRRHRRSRLRPKPAEAKRSLRLHRWVTVMQHAFQFGDGLAFIGSFGAAGTEREYAKH